ncbi:hypothetical protein EG329_008482 [Mollisiaceae sp. DMI_Dod_QoI]|nr:hypothetical protein EG329_008482 [Helotiales sp. DMI_Dod_QoI]
MVYTYQPLTGPRSIRLLSFDSETSSSDLIRVQLEIVDLDSIPGYWALSYTWGSPVPSSSPSSSPLTKHEILCGGESFLVGSNLYDFLKRFNGSNRVFWIDAICINQDDISERNAQVSIMVWIYSKAEGTFIWLGESDDTSVRSLDLLVKFAEAKKKLGEDHDKVLRRRWDFNDVEFYAAVGMEPWSQEDWKVLLDFYSRSWFRRQWVMQEVIANDQAVVFCGNQGMPWPYFMDLTQFLIPQRWVGEIMALESRFHKAGSPASITSTYDFIGLLDRKNLGPTKPSTEILLSILSDYQTDSQRFDAFVLYTVYRMRGREATVAADHVYAPLSLASKCKGENDPYQRWTTARLLFRSIEISLFT